MTMVAPSYRAKTGQFAKRVKGSPRVPVPCKRVGAENAHPLVRAFLHIMDEQHTSPLDVLERAGMARDTIRRWATKHCPKLDNFEAALNVLGYRLAIVPIDCTRPQDMARWERRSTVRENDENVMRDNDLVAHTAYQRDADGVQSEA